MIAWHFPYPRLMIVAPLSLVFLATGCMSEVDRKHHDLSEWCWVINDGKGSHRPFPWTKDYFTLAAESLDDRYESVRLAAALKLTTCSVMIGRKYVFLLDAYVDAGRGEHLRKHLRQALAKQKPGTRERIEIVHVILELAMREYLWKHPEVASDLGLDRQEPPRRGWEGFVFHRGNDTQYRFFAERILPTGDEDFARVWKELVEYYGLVREDKGSGKTMKRGIDRDEVEDERASRARELPRHDGAPG